MTIFSDNPHDRRMERLMMTVPNFAPRGVGFRFTEAQVFIMTTAATPTEILTATMRQIRCPPFRKRFNEYIESEEIPMTYINEKHRARFELAARNVHRENYAVLSALYLLTADQRLWSCCKHHINNGCVFFENIKEIDREIADLMAQNLVLSRLHGKGVLNAADYTAQSDVLENKITELRIERRTKITDSDGNKMLEELKMLSDILKEVEIGIGFDAELFEQTVDSITVESNELLTFHLAGGISLPEKIREKGRCYKR